MAFKIRGPRTLFTGTVAEVRAVADPDGAAATEFVIRAGKGEDRDTIVLRSYWPGLRDQIQEGAQFQVELTRVSGNFSAREQRR